LSLLNLECTRDNDDPPPFPPPLPERSLPRLTCNVDADVEFNPTTGVVDRLGMDVAVDRPGVDFGTDRLGVEPAVDRPGVELAVD